MALDPRTPLFIDDEDVHEAAQALFAAIRRRSEREGAIHKDWEHASVAAELVVRYLSQLTNDQLEEVVRDTDGMNETNCWFMAYHARGLLQHGVRSQKLHRHESSCPGDGKLGCGRVHETLDRESQ